MAIVPRMSLMQTWTDNLLLDDRNKDAALITTVSPGISIVSNSGALRGSFDYSLNGIGYLKTDRPTRLQNTLFANLQAELISGHFYIDSRASIGQQNVSAFGQLSAPTLGSQGAVNDLANPNQRETGMLTVSPSLRGNLGSVATYELRGDLTRTEVRGSGLGDGRSGGGSLRISQRDAGALGWWLAATSQQSRFDGTNSNNVRSVQAGLNYRPDPDWAFGANVGRERSDYLGAGDRSGVTGGVTAQWTPTPRTRIGADWQRHSYGNSHGLNFEHRLQRSIWRFSETVTTTLGNTGSVGGVRTNYDMFYALFASLEPDPGARDALVRKTLLQMGLSPDAPATGGFLSSGPSRLRSQQFGFTLQGVRTTVTGQVLRSITSRLGSNVNQGDLANSSKVEQRSYSFSASHQLTPLSGLTLTASRQETQGDLGGQSGQLSTLMVNWTFRLGARLSGQFGGRHSSYEGVIPYTENAAFANLTQQF